MAKLPPIDVQAIWIRDLLNRGRRPEALALLEKALSTGRAGPDTMALADYLRTAKRGRPPFGAKHLYWDIGVENDILRSAGKRYEQRMSILGASYMLDVTQVELAIAKYEIVSSEISELNRES